MDRATMSYDHDKITGHILTSLDMLNRKVYRVILDLLYENVELKPGALMEDLQTEIESLQKTRFMGSLNALRKTGWITFEQPEGKVEILAVRLTPFGKSMLESVYHNQKLLEAEYG